MSLDDALEQMRKVEVEPPAFTEIEQRRRWKASRALPRRRTQIAVLASAVAVLGYIVLSVRPFLDFVPRSDGLLAEWWRVSVATLVPAFLIAWAIRLVRREGVGPQMLCRAIWWSNLVVGTLIAGNFLKPVDRFVGIGIALSCAGALLAVGARGLDPDKDGPFQPSRFRGHLLLALVMAFADAQTLLFSAVMQLRLGMDGWTLLGTIEYAGPAAGAAAVMALAVWGLYRLRTWALFLNLLANFAIAFFALEGHLNVALPVAATLAATAACQAFIPVPILAVALGERRAGRPVLRNHANKLLTISVLTIATTALVVGVAETNPSGWLTGPGRAFRRGLELAKYQPADLVGRDLRGVPLEDLRLTRANMRDANLSGVRGRGLRFDNAKMAGVDLTDAELHDSFFGFSDLTGADLRGADFRGSRFRGANLRDARLDGASFEFVDLRHARAWGAVLTGASLRGAYLEEMPEALAAEVNWGGATCPNGERAHDTLGCVGKEGHLPTDERAGYDVTLTPSDSDWTCDPMTIPREMEGAKYLRFMTRKFVRVGDSEFIAKDITLTVDFPKVVYEHERCGRIEFTREE